MPALARVVPTNLKNNDETSKRMRYVLQKCNATNDLKSAGGRPRITSGGNLIAGFQLYCRTPAGNETCRAFLTP